tara:strand:- start:272 stop:640 length:369 start_codon:yes stop_codon:yes gene_type:complete
MRTARILVVLLVALLPLSGCIEESSDSATSEPSDYKDGVRISEDGEFTPSYIEVPKGYGMSFYNDDAVKHTVTSDDGYFDFEVLPNQRVANSIDDYGEFPYHCKIHPSMTGEIFVPEPEDSQ